MPDSDMKKKAVFNWSGGKDSALALLSALRSNQYDIVSLLTTVNRDTKRSSMHSIPDHVLRAQADSIGLPLYMLELIPDGSMSDYEQGMHRAVNHFKTLGVTHFIFGDIFLHDVRSYREKQLAPYGMEVVEPLWDRSSEEVMEEFLTSGLCTVVVTTQADILGKEFVGRIIDRDFVASLPAGVDICGEQGEYHTLCFEGPLFARPVAFQLEEPYLFSHEVGLEDGSVKTYSYWFAGIR